MMPPAHQNLPQAAAARPEALKRSVRDHFDNDSGWLGGVYDSSIDPYARGVQRRVAYVMDMITDLDGPEHRVALDVGCGPGAYLEWLGRIGWNVFGMDFSSAMLRSCAARLREATAGRLLAGDAERLPVKDGSVDLLLVIGVLQYLPSPAAALAEFTRVLRTGGYAVISFENLFALCNLDWYLRKRFRRFLERGRTGGTGGGEGVLWMGSEYFAEGVPTPHEYRLYNPWAFEMLMAGYGFSMVRRMTYGHEFRAVRRAIPGAERLLSWIEIRLESLGRRSRLPYLPWTGKFYVGVFRKTTDADPVAPAGGGGGSR